MRLYYQPDDGPRPFRLVLGGHEFKITLRGLGALTDAANDAFDRYNQDRNGKGPGSKFPDLRNPTEKEIDEL